MNASNPLAQLRDIHLPEPVSWWPLAPGWWLLIVAMFILLVWLGIKWRQRQQFRKAFIRCRQEINAIAEAYQKNPDNRQLIAQYSQLMRRVLMLRLGRDKVASVTGEELISLLEEHGLAKPLTNEVRELLVEGPYRKDIEFSDFNHIKHSLDETLLKISLYKVSY